MVRGSMSPISARCQNTGASEDAHISDDDDEELEEEGEGGGWPSRKLPLRRASKTGERATRMTLDA